MMGLVDAMYSWFLPNSYFSMVLERWVFRGLLTRVHVRFYEPPIVSKIWPLQCREIG